MINIVIPCAGEGKRFVEAGYVDPKPLIGIGEKTMLQRVIDNITPIQDHRFIVISRAEHKIPQHWVDGHIIGLDYLTEGAVSTILEARNFITDDPMLIANSDQLVDFDVNEFIKSEDNALVTFRSNNPHHSYVEIENNKVIRIVEKEVISNNAVTGIYYFKHGTDFLKSAIAVIASEQKTKGEYYVSTVIDHMLKNGYIFISYEAPTAILGTPQELQTFEVALRISKKL